MLGAAVQEHFGQKFPFPEFFAEVGQREVRDFTVGEWVEFILRNLVEAPGAPMAEGAGGGEARA